MPPIKYLPRCLREPAADVSGSMLWPHDTCKSDDNCNSFSSPQHRPPSLSSPVQSYNIMISQLHLRCKRKMKNFGVRETRTSSRNESIQLAVAAESQINQMQGTKVTRSMSTTEWTDEKHSLYLKSMEASFVNQLYDSKEMLGWSSGRHANISDPNLLMDALFNSTTTSGQFKVLRGGCWRKIKYERNNTETNRANDQCEAIKSNPWIRHFRTSAKHQGLASRALEDCSTSTSQVVDLGARKGISSASEITSKQLHFYESQISQLDMFCSDTEMSDQNFVDEKVAEGEKENKRSNKKRMRSSITGTSGIDQIVPVSKFSTTGDGGGTKN